MMGALVEYWYYTKDDSFVDLTKEGLLYQIGDENDYVPRNQSLTEGNDDQGFWGLAVMSAAEYNFPEGKEEDDPGWLALAQAVFNTQAARWDTEHCGGGLRWQIYNWNKGWDYKNSISQGTFFSLAARLALFTGNTTYADWASKSWDWMIALEFIDEHWYVYDGAHTPNNCTDIVPWQFSYNAGTFILGAAAMYNFTEDDAWKDRLDNLLDGAMVFFRGDDENIMEEVACEPVDRCNIDQQSFKAYFSRWLAAITQWVPETYDVVAPLLRASAIAATNQCSGGDNGRMCGLKWSEEKYDGSTGVGQQMAALEVTLSCMIKERDPILTSDTGGTSEGDPTAGGNDIGRTEPPPTRNFGPVTAGQKAGAAILTALIICSMLAGMFWMFLDETSDKGAWTQTKGAHTSVAAVTTAVFTPVSGAAVLTKRNSQRHTREFNEKSEAQGEVTSPDTSSNEQVAMPTAPAPLVMQRSEHRASGRHSRRLSNMPIGWPHNTSMRSSVIGEPGSERPPSEEQSSKSPRIPDTGEINRASGSGLPTPVTGRSSGANTPPAVPPHQEIPERLSEESRSRSPRT